MTPEAFRASAMALPGATLDVKWGVDQVFSVGGKMFAAMGIDPEGATPPRYAFKASDGSFAQLIEEGLAIPAPYSARFKWVQLARVDALPDDQLSRYLEIAHALVAAGLTRKARAALGLA
jgi:predicted DNA-binding protein (MmcQ/YjbR family)